MKTFFLLLVFILSYSNYSYSNTWNNYKTERVKVAEGVVIERKITSSNKIISEEYKLLINGTYFDAEFKDGKWQLSVMGKDAFDAFKEGDQSVGGGGGC